MHSTPLCLILALCCYFATAFTNASFFTVYANGTELLLTSIHIYHVKQ